MLKLNSDDLKDNLKKAKSCMISPNELDAKLTNIDLQFKHIIDVLNETKISIEKIIKKYNDINTEFVLLKQDVEYIKKDNNKLDKKQMWFISILMPILIILINYFIMRK